MSLTRYLVSYPDVWPAHTLLGWKAEHHRHASRGGPAPAPHAATGMMPCCVASGWEVTPVPASDYWKEVPLQLAQKVHRYNVPADADPKSPFNVINIITSMCKPGDFVVVKLDIDNQKVETALMVRLKSTRPAMSSEICSRPVRQLPFPWLHMHDMPFSSYGSGSNSREPEGTGPHLRDVLRAAL